MPNMKENMSVVWYFALKFKLGMKYEKQAILKIVD